MFISQKSSVIWLGLSISVLHYCIKVIDFTSDMSMCMSIECMQLIIVRTSLLN